MKDDERQTYYDHEPAYRRIAERGGSGWDDFKPDVVHASYRDLDAFLDSPHGVARPGARLTLAVRCDGAALQRQPTRVPVWRSGPRGELHRAGLGVPRAR